MGWGVTGIQEWRNWPFLAGGIRNQADFARRNSECEYAAEAEFGQKYRRNSESNLFRRSGITTFSIAECIFSHLRCEILKLFSNHGGDFQILNHFRSKIYSFNVGGIVFGRNCICHNSHRRNRNWRENAWRKTELDIKYGRNGGMDDPGTPRPTGSLGVRSYPIMLV